MRNKNVKTIPFLCGLVLILCIQFIQSQKRETGSPMINISSENIMRLDSTITYNNEGEKLVRTEYIYLTGENGQIQAISHWDESVNDWGYDNRIIYKYDEYDNIVWNENQLWDTQVNDWVPYDRVISAYTEKGLPTLTSTYLWDSDADLWKGISKQTVVYDDENRIIQQEGFSWDDIEDRWIGSHKNIMAFDVYDNLVLIEIYNWNYGLNDWYLDSKNTYTYDEAGNLLSNSNYLWNTESNSLEIIYKEETILNEIGQIGERTFYAETDLGLQPNKRIHYLYNEDRSLSNEEIYSINSESGEWYMSEKNEYTYEEDGSVYKIISSWNPSANEWNLRKRSIYKYDENHYMIIEENANWSEMLSGWRNSTRIIREYDTNGKIIYQENQDWKNSQWTGVNRYIHAYNTNNQQILNERYHWDEIKNRWIGEAKAILEYDDSGKVLLSENYKWDNASDRWIGNFKYTNSYTENGEINSSANFQWDTASWNWINNSRSETLFDTDGLKTSFTYSIWNIGTNQWDISYLTEYLNENGLLQKETYYLRDAASELKPGNYVIYYYSSPELSLSEEMINFTFEGGEKTIDLFSNRVWNISSNPGWIIVTPISGDGNKQLSILASENESNTLRSGFITVTTPGITVQLKITQDRKTTPSDYYLELSDYRLNIPAHGSTETVFIYSNTSWRVNPEVDWVTVTPLSGINDRLIEISASPNSGKQRTTSVIVTGDHVSNSVIEIIQAEETTTGIDDLNSPEIIITPNPVTDYFQIIGIDTPVVINIYDLGGNLRLNKKAEPHEQVLVDHLTKGLYIVKVVTTKETVIKKIIKQ